MSSVSWAQDSFSCSCFQATGACVTQHGEKVVLSPLVQNNLDIKLGDHGGHPIHRTAHHNIERRNNIIDRYNECSCAVQISDLIGDLFNTLDGIKGNGSE